MTNDIGLARRLGVVRLYLYTNGSESLYSRLGWRTFCRELYEGRSVTVMAARLAAEGAGRRLT